MPIFKKDDFSFHHTKAFLYCQFDKKTAQTLFYQVAENDSRAILNLLQRTFIPLTNSDLYRLGEIVTDLPSVDPSIDTNYSLDQVLSFKFYDSPKFVPWSACKLPETPADSLAPLGLNSEEVKQIIQNQLNLKTSVREV